MIWLMGVRRPWRILAKLNLPRLSGCNRVTAAMALAANESTAGPRCSMFPRKEDHN
jgi:hypothetical protein